MTSFSVRTAEYRGSRMLNICDAGLLGRDFSGGGLSVSISSGCYGGRTVGREEAEALLRGASIINMAGRETVSLSTGLGIGAEGGVREVGGVPFLIVFKM